MKYFLSILLICCFVNCFSQSKNYTSQNIHSHNDYKQAHPFYTAYNAQVGSMEADIYLEGNKLLVAHTSDEILESKTLEAMYLDKIDSCLKVHNGAPYADASMQLQLLIDLKTDGIPLLKELIKHLQNYPAIIGCKKIIITITGNIPIDALMPAYPSFIHFDGVLSKQYSPEAVKKIAMFSDDFMKYIEWRQNGTLAVDVDFMKKQVERVRRLGKTFRLWGAPDNAVTWTTLMKLGVDYINTDRIAPLASFLKNQ